MDNSDYTTAKQHLLNATHIIATDHYEEFLAKWAKCEIAYGIGDMDPLSSRSLPDARRHCISTMIGALHDGLQFGNW